MHRIGRARAHQTVVALALLRAVLGRLRLGPIDLAPGPATSRARGREPSSSRAAALSLDEPAASFGVSRHPGEVVGPPSRTARVVGGTTGDGDGTGFATGGLADLAAAGSIVYPSETRTCIVVAPCIAMNFATECPAEGLPAPP